MVGSRADARDATPVHSLGARSAGGLGAERDQPACKEKARSTSTRCKNGRGRAVAWRGSKEGFRTGRTARVRCCRSCCGRSRSEQPARLAARPRCRGHRRSRRPRAGRRPVHTCPQQKRCCAGSLHFEATSPPPAFRTHSSTNTPSGACHYSGLTKSLIHSSHAPSFHQTRAQPRHPHARVCRCVHGRAIAPTATCAMCG